jgi:hypothetical protein
LEDPAIEALLYWLLLEHCKVAFVGIIEWFLGVHFSWCISSSSIAVHLNQSGLASILVESLFRDAGNPTPTATPYQSGISINIIVPYLDHTNSLAQVQGKEAYQSLIGNIGWLAHTSWPDLMAIHSFLSSYSNKPSVGFITFTLHMTMGFLSPQKILHPCIVSSIIFL